MIDNSYELTDEEMELARLGWQVAYSFCSEDDYLLPKDMIDWLNENDMANKAIVKETEHEVVHFICRIWVDCKESAMALKLRWYDGKET